MAIENLIEKLRARAVWFRTIAVGASDDEAARTLQLLAEEADRLIRAIEDNANGDQQA